MKILVSKHNSFFQIFTHTLTKTKEWDGPATYKYRCALIFLSLGMQ